MKLKKKQEDRTLWIMEHAVIFVCISMQLQTVLCYSYTYDMIFVTYFL
jgi:hypothetical protein